MTHSAVDRLLEDGLWHQDRPELLGHKDVQTTMVYIMILPKAHHAQWEAKVGSNAEVKSLQRFVPAYFTTIQDWLGKRIRGPFLDLHNLANRVIPPL